MNTYLLLKSLHIFGIIIFLGNIIVTGWWKIMADKTRDARIISFAQRQVTLTDYTQKTSPRNGKETGWENIAVK